MVAEIIVSHGYFVDETSRALGTEMTDQVMDRLCFYAAVTNYKLAVNGDGNVDATLLHASASDHIQTRA